MVVPPTRARFCGDDVRRWRRDDGCKPLSVKSCRRRCSDAPRQPRAQRGRRAHDRRRRACDWPTPACAPKRHVARPVVGKFAPSHTCGGVPPETRRRRVATGKSPARSAAPRSSDQVRRSRATKSALRAMRIGTRRRCLGVRGEVVDDDAVSRDPPRRACAETRGSRDAARQCPAVSALSDPASSGARHRHPQTRVSARRSCADASYANTIPAELQSKPLLETSTATPPSRACAGAHTIARGDEHRGRGGRNARAQTRRRGEMVRESPRPRRQRTAREADDVDRR